VAGNGNKTEGAMLGAILGYTANAAACRQGARTWPKVQQYQEPQSQRFVPQGQYQGGYAPVSQQYPQQLYAQPQQQECGQGQITVRNPDGTIQRAVTAMCRINGEWKIVQ
jgi:hypothetical protein